MEDAGNKLPAVNFRNARRRHAKSLTKAITNDDFSIGCDPTLHYGRRELSGSMAVQTETDS